MTIRHLQIFLSVYRSGSMTAAAQQLFLTQPAVTRAIRELEEEYGVALFERIHPHLSVTEAGKTFYAYALHLTDTLEQLDQEMHGWDDSGILRIGASVTLGSRILPKVLAESKQKHPGLRIRAGIMNGTKLQEALVENELDLAMIEGQISDPRLAVQELGEDRLCLLFPPDSPLQKKEKLFMSDLLSYPMLLREKESMSRIFMDRVFEKYDFQPDPLMESVSNHALVQGVHAGLGISFLPHQLVEHALESGFIATRRIEDEELVRKNDLVYLKNKHFSRSMQEIMELCRAVFPKNIG